MHQYVQPIAAELRELANHDKAVAMKAYMRNQFRFLGIQATERRRVYKAYTKQNVVKSQDELEAIIRELWLLPEREFQYYAVELLFANNKIWTTTIIELIEYCIVNKSWWDTVDPIASDCCGKYFKIFPGAITSITSKWNSSSNIWLQRSSLLFQKNYKQETDKELLSKYVVELAESSQFFIQKAIGWILREYAKTNSDWVRSFVQQNKLAPLSKREAMKHL